MSTIPTKQIDGDVAVGRNVSAGGDANIQGNVRVGHNLRVDGWLDARNIKGPNRGLFPTVEALKSQCPLPHAGWYALVGDTLPATVYMGVDGEWVTMGKQGGNPTLDSSKYDSDIETLESDVADIKRKIVEHTAFVDEKIDVFNTELTDVRKGSVNEVNISATVSDGGHPSAPKLFLYRQGLEPLSVAFPLAIDTEAGLMTAEQVAALEQVIEDVATAQGTAEGMAVTKLEFFNMENGHYGAIGLSQGGKAAASVMIPHATTERSGLMCRGQAIHLDELYTEMPGVKTSLTEAHSKADAAQATADGAQTSADAALAQARAAEAKGLQLPRFSGTVIDGVPHGASVLNQGAGLRSDSPGCAVVFDKSCNRFLLRVREAGVMSHTFYTMWVDAASMGLTQDMDPELPRLYKASQGVAYLATEPPYGLYFLGEGMADLIAGSQPPTYDDFSEEVKEEIDASLTTEKVKGPDGRSLEARLTSDREQMESQLSNVLAEDPETPCDFPGISIFSREQLKKDLFIDRWNSACGQYGKYAPEDAPDAEHPFLLNGLWLTYEEALVSYFRPLQTETECASRYSNTTGLRTNICTLKTVYWHPVSLSNIAETATDLEVLRISTNNSVHVKEHAGAFTNASKLKSIYPVIYDSYDGAPVYAWKNTFRNCHILEDVQIHELKYSLDFRESPRLSLASLQYIVANAANTATITITVHPEVYAKLNDETDAEWHALVAQAAEKNINFATV